MNRRDYGQYCGLARSLDLLGERWALLIVRDLLSGPHRFGELQGSLAGIPTNVLTNRLKELEAAGVVERQLLAAPARGTAYALTEDGRALEPTLIALGQWGASRLGDPREGEIVTAESLAMALRTTFQPAVAGGRRRPITYELRVGEDITISAEVAQGRLEVRLGPATDPDLVIRTGPRLREVLSGELSPRKALEVGAAEIEGDPRSWERFTELFAIPVG